jgi:hypothetical protein
MKKQAVFLLLFALLGFFACQNADEKQTAEPETTTDQQVESQAEADVQMTEPEQSESEKTVFQAEDIEIGDEICNMKVSSVNYQEGELFEISFNGDVTLQGTVYENPMEYAMEFTNESEVAQIAIEGETYSLFKYLILSKEHLVTDSFSEEENTIYASGSPVARDITVKNPTYTISFAEKGRQRFGEAELVE